MSSFASKLFPTEVPASAEFAGFPRLPPELRAMIWKYAIPEPRVFEVFDTPQSNSKTPAEQGLAFANGSYEPPPALAVVCQESRAFMLRFYKPLTLSRVTKYIDPSRDIILLEPYLLTRRLLRALHFLAQIPHLRDNMNQIALGTSYGFHTGISYPVMDGKVSRKNIKMLLAKLSIFPRLQKILFIIHEEFQFTTLKLAFPGWSYSLQHFHHNYPQSLEGRSANSIGRRWRFHRNELRFCPFKTEDDKCDDLDEEDCSSNEEEDGSPDRLPTNDDWKRFSRRFLKAVDPCSEGGAAGCSQSKQPTLKIEGANLLWQYHSY